MRFIRSDIKQRDRFVHATAGHRELVSGTREKCVRIGRVRKHFVGDDALDSCLPIARDVSAILPANDVRRRLAAGSSITIPPACSARVFC